MGLGQGCLSRDLVRPFHGQTSFSLYLMLSKYFKNMFGLFKRSKIETWEIVLLRSVLSKLPSEYSRLISQIDDGLLRSVIITHIPGNVSFGFTSDLLKKYEKPKERDFKLTDIKVYDSKTSSYLPYEIMIGSGMICGYKLGLGKKADADVGNIDVSNVKKRFFDNLDYEEIIGLLNEKEKRLLNPSDVYLVSIESKEYFHIKDLEDGDFIGIDRNKIVYKITHDPCKVTKLYMSLTDILK